MQLVLFSDLYISCQEQFCLFLCMFVPKLLDTNCGWNKKLLMDTFVLYLSQQNLLIRRNSLVKFSKVFCYVKNPKNVKFFVRIKLQTFVCLQLNSVLPINSQERKVKMVGRDVQVNLNFINEVGGFMLLSTQSRW